MLDIEEGYSCFALAAHLSSDLRRVCVRRAGPEQAEHLGTSKVASLSLQSSSPFDCSLLADGSA